MKGRTALVGSAFVVAAFAAGGVGARQPSADQIVDESTFHAVILEEPAVTPSDGPVAVNGPEHRVIAGGPEGAPVAKRAIGTGRAIPPTSPSTRATASRPAPTGSPASSGPVAAFPRTGFASWYPATGMIGAVHSWRWGDVPYTVTVCAGRCIVVTVSDYCQGCVGPRLIDLSDDAFCLLAPLSAGLVSIEMR